MFLPELTDHIRCSLRMKRPEERATTLPPSGMPPGAVDRPLTGEEHAIAEWLLCNAEPPALDFLPQLKVARVMGRCSCGCPTIDLSIPDDTPRAQPRDNPIGDAFAFVGPHQVGVMLLQRGGHLTGLEIYDLSEIVHPYPLPSLATFEVARWSEYR